MILVDTNVVSEPLKARADPRVVTWLYRQAADALFISTISVSEILFGVASLAAGKRRNRLAAAFENAILRLFAGRILSFDLEAARAYASLMSAARGRGVPIPIVDGQIAAIAKANGFSVATRDEAPFRAAGLNVVNPWTE
ncbi:MAG TPA: type II toxin-antitoxin system VapC family toxin [Roseiarcus sp.]